VAVPRIVLVAGETSGDRLGASLIREASALRPDLRFEGVAGPLMKEAGCAAWFDSEELAVMGLVEVLRHLPRLRQIKNALERRLIADPPAAFVGIDAPDFNLRVEPRLRAAGVTTVQYVCPQVWAWRSRRVAILRRACDRVLCLLPFEVDFLERHGVPATFVGHPLADEIADSPDRDSARRALGIDAGTVVGLLPGSRGVEVERLGPVFARTAAWLSGRHNDIAFAAPMATSSLKSLFARYTEEFAPGCDVRLYDRAAQDVLAASDAVLTASGTAALETMLVNRPMVVAYRVAPLTHVLLRFTQLGRMPYFSLPNLLAGRKLVPEYIQHDATPENLGRALSDILESESMRQNLSAQYAALHRTLRQSAASQAARAVLDCAGLS